MPPLQAILARQKQWSTFSLESRGWMRGWKLCTSASNRVSCRDVRIPKKRGQGRQASLTDCWLTAPQRDAPPEPQTMRAVNIAFSRGARDGAEGQWRRESATHPTLQP